MVTGRSALNLRASVTSEAVPFIADPPPLEGQFGPWAQRQFEALQRVVGRKAEIGRVEALEAKVAALQAQVDALAVIVGDGSWDGGTP